MTLDLKYPQTPDKTLVIILGASAWPEASEIASSVAFAKGAQKVKNYFKDCFNVPESNLLWLFDEQYSAQDMYKQIRNFIKENVESVKQVITYYIGHGVVAAKGDGLYLPIRETQQFILQDSSLNVESLMETIRFSAPQLKRIYILDCCFAAKALPFLQTSAIASNGTDDLLRSTLRHANRSENYAALFASGHNNPAIYLPDEINTFFTEAFLRVATNTTEILSLLDIKERMEACLNDLFKIYEQTYPDLALPPLPQIYESEVARLPLFPSTVIQTDQLIIEVAKCLTQTPFREIRLIYCDPPTRTVRVLCSKFQGNQDFHHIFQQVEKDTGWRIKVDVWEEIASIIACPIIYLPSEKEDTSLNGANGQRLPRKTSSEPKLTEEENNRLEKEFKRTVEKLLNQMGKSLQSSQYQASQRHFRIIVPGITELEKHFLRLKFQEAHPGYKLGVAVRS